LILAAAVDRSGPSGTDNLFIFQGIAAFSQQAAALPFSWTYLNTVCSRLEKLSHLWS